MKKLLSLLFLTIMIFALVACDKSMPESATLNNVSKDEITQMNNFSANLGYASAAKIGDKLYYAYFDSVENQIMYDITTGKAKKIYEGKSNSIRSFDFRYIIEGNMLLSTDSGAFAVFEPQQLKVIGMEDIYSPAQLNDDPLLNDEWCQYIIGDVRYFADTKHFYRYQNEEYELVLSADSANDEHFFFAIDGYFCVYGSELYYLHSKNDGVYICRYDMNNKKPINEAIISTDPDTLPCFSLIADGDDVYYSDYEALYHINLVNKQSEEIYRAKGNSPLLFVNYNNGNLYIGVNTLENSEDDGLYVVNTGDNDTPEKLIDGMVSSVYIFDNDYIYYGMLYNDSNDFSFNRLLLADNSTEEILRIE